MSATSQSKLQERERRGRRNFGSFHEVNIPAPVPSAGLRAGSSQNGRRTGYFVLAAAAKIKSKGWAFGPEVMVWAMLL
jgi:hypothetical protein